MKLSLTVVAFVSFIATSVLASPYGGYVKSSGIISGGYTGNAYPVGWYFGGGAGGGSVGGSVVGSVGIAQTYAPNYAPTSHKSYLAISDRYLDNGGQQCKCSNLSVIE